ncbi:MAG: sulfatase/phosphatase domain-containing protein, partial [Verrucomicrobiota bacterium]
RWPDHVSAGGRCGKLVSVLDIAPTFLACAGIPIPDAFRGIDFRPLLSDPDTAIRDFVFAEKNWHDYEDHVRMVRSERFKLLHNGYPDLPQTPSADSARSPTFQVLLAKRNSEELTMAQKSCFSAPRAALELYDVDADPHELTNLVEEADVAAVKKELILALDGWAKETGDYVPLQRTADEFDRVTGTPTPARVRPRHTREKMVADGLVAP